MDRGTYLKHAGRPAVPFQRTYPHPISWGGEELHFRLEPNGQSRCSLRLIDVLEAGEAAARNAAGWSVCLAELDKLVAGQVTDGPPSDTAESWQDHYDAYVAAGVPLAPIPSATERSA